MLSNPVSAYSNQLSNISSDTSSTSLDDSFFFEDCEDNIGMLSGSTSMAQPMPSTSSAAANSDLNTASEQPTKVKKDFFQKVDNLASLAKTFADNVLADPNTCPSTVNASGKGGGRELSLDGCSSSSTNDAGNNGLFCILLA